MTMKKMKLVEKGMDKEMILEIIEVMVESITNYHNNQEESHN